MIRTNTLEMQCREFILGLVERETKLTFTDRGNVILHDIDVFYEVYQKAVDQERAVPLKQNGAYVLSVPSTDKIESHEWQIYLHPELRNRFADKYGGILNENAN